MDRSVALRIHAIHFRKKTALAARAKHLQLSIEQAKDPLNLTWIGRLRGYGVDGNGLSNDQYNAAQSFLKIMNDYKKSILSPDAFYEEIETSGDPEAHARFCQHAKEKYNAALKAVQEAQFEDKTENLYAALEYVVVRDYELPHLLYATRIVLNVLHRHFHNDIVKTRCFS